MIEKSIADSENQFGMLKKFRKQKMEKPTKKRDRKNKHKQIQKEINDIMSDWTENYDKTDLLEVVWEDARTLSGTSDYIGIKENGLLTARTIGYLIYEDNKKIAICGFLFPDEHHSLNDPIQNTAFRDVHIIPKGWIKVVKILETNWEETKKFRKENQNWFGLQ